MPRPTASPPCTPTRPPPSTSATPGWAWGTLFNPWPDDDQRARITTRIHTFDSRAELLNGPDEGLTWGIQDWAPYTERDGARTAVDDASIRFMLPTVQYFVEMPQRLTEAELVRHVGQQTVGGDTYDVVYATWGTLEANAEYDQYLLFFAPESGRLAKAQYTVREMMNLAVGTIHLDDQRAIDGYWVPHRMTVTSSPQDDPDTYMHRMVLTDFHFDADGALAGL